MYNSKIYKLNCRGSVLISQQFQGLLKQKFPSKVTCIRFTVRFKTTDNITRQTSTFLWPILAAQPDHSAIWATSGKGLKSDDGEWWKDGCSQYKWREAVARCRDLWLEKSSLSRTSLMLSRSDLRVYEAKSDFACSRTIHLSKMSLWNKF